MEDDELQALSEGIEPEAEQEPDYDTEEQDDDLSDEEDQEEIVSEEPAAEEEVEPEPVQSSYVDPGETPAEAKLRELLADPEISAALDAAMSAKISKALQSYGASQVHLTTAAAQHPELFRVYGPKLNTYISEQPENIRGQKLGMDAAVARLILEEAQKSDMATAVAKVNGMMGKQPAAKSPKTPIPAAQRPPSPSTGTPAPASARESKIKFAMKTFGLSRSEAEDAYGALTTGGTRRG